MNGSNKYDYQGGIMEYYIKIACQIYGVGTFREIPYSLQNRLRRVNDMCRIVGRRLYSVDTIAMIIEQWERDGKLAGDD
jgi:hypothetical protein